MQRVQNRVQTDSQFSVAPLRASVPGVTLADQLTFLVLADRDVYARKGKLRAILRHVSPQRQAALVAAFTR